MDEEELELYERMIDAVQRQYEESDIFVGELMEPLADENGYVPGTYRVKPAPTYG